MAQIKSSAPCQQLP